VNPQKTAGGELLFDRLHAQLRHHGVDVDQMYLDILVLTHNIFDVIQFDGDEYELRLGIKDEKAVCHFIWL
jgi:hypothetical protein